MAPNLITKAELARRAGVTKQAISDACKHSLAAAKQGHRLDANHPAVQLYLSRRTHKTPLVDVAPPSPSAEADYTCPPIEAIDLPGLEGVEGIAHMTLAEACETFGTAIMMKDWLAARQKQNSVRKTEIEILQIEGELIERSRVEQHVFGALEGATRRLLQDLPKTAVRRMYSACRANTPIEEAERLLRDLISTQLAPVKNQLDQGLNASGEEATISRQDDES